MPASDPLLLSHRQLQKDFFVAEADFSRTLSPLPHGALEASSRWGYEEKKTGEHAQRIKAEEMHASNDAQRTNAAEHTEDLLWLAATYGVEPHCIVAEKFRSVVSRWAGADHGMVKQMWSLPPALLNVRTYHEFAEAMAEYFTGIKLH